MDAELIALARRLAEGGHLPGITNKYKSPHVNEADILFSVWTAMNKPGWAFDKGLSNVFVEVHDPSGIKKPRTFAQPGTTTLSLLRAYAAALEVK